MANQIAVKFDPISLIQDKSRLAVPYQTASSAEFCNSKTVNAVVFPQQSNLVPTVTFRNITQNHSIYVTFRPVSGAVDPDNRAVVIFQNIDEDHTVHALFEHTPQPLLTKKTVLLLHFVGNVGTRLVQDTSSYEHLVSPSLGFSLQRIEKRWGKTSGFFNIQEYVSTYSEDYEFGTDDFTVDFWFRITSLNFITGLTSAKLFESWDGLDSFMCSYAIVNDVKYFNLSINQVSVLLGEFPTLAINTWFHVAVVRSSGTIKAYIDGVALAETVSVPGNVASNSWTIGEYYRGYIDEFRIVNGEAVWTSNFTPPTGPYSDEMNAEFDVVFDLPARLSMVPESIYKGDYIKLLAHMDGAEASTTLIDSSVYEHPMTVYNGGHLTAAGNIKLGIAGMFSGSNFLSMPDSDVWNFGSEDFTIDFWVMFQNIYVDTTQSKAIQLPFFRQGTDGATGVIGMEFRWTDAALYIAVRINEITIGYGSVLSSVLYYTWWKEDPEWFYGRIPNEKFAHVALVTKDTYTYVYVNGVKILTGSGNIEGGFPFIFTDCPGQFEIGRSFNKYLKGSMRQFRFSKGIARWDSDFDPYSINYAIDQYTKIYIPMSGTMGSTVFTNTGLTSMSITNNNNVVIGNPENSFGNSAALFDGIDDYVSVPDSAHWYMGTHDFTIDFRMKIVLRQVSGQSIFLADVYPLFSQGEKGTEDYYGLELNHADSNNYKIVFYVGTRSYVIPFLSSSNVSLYNDEEWHHVAIVSYQRRVSVYYDGREMFANMIYVDTQLGEPGGLIPFPNASSEFIIGSDGVNFFKGYIDEFRVSHRAEWRAYFTPPTEPYVDPPTTPIPGGIIEIVSTFDSELSLETVFRAPGEYDIEHNMSMEMLVTMGPMEVPVLRFNAPMSLVMLREGTEETYPFVFTNRWKTFAMADYSNVVGIEGDYLIALLDTHFVFDPDVHEYFVDQVDAYEIDVENGYVQNIPVEFDSFTSGGILKFKDVWLPTASGGSYGPVNSVVICDYASEVRGIIVGCITLPEAILNYGTMKLSDLSFQIV